MALHLTNTLITFLREHCDQPFTAREIALWIFENYPDECQEKKQKSTFINTDDELIQQLVAEISSSRPALEKNNPELRTTEGRPRKYYYTIQSESEEVQALEAPQYVVTENKKKYCLEHDLYPQLSQYLWIESGIYSKRIDEKRSSNRRGPNGNRWLYPDVVAMEDLSADWDQEVKDCVGQYADKRTRLWSFEVKLLINVSMSAKYSSKQCPTHRGPTLVIW